MVGRTNTGGGSSGATLTITGVVGATVTVSKDGKTYTRTINNSGTAVFKGLSTGTWTVTMSGNGQTTTRTVEIVADYSLAIAYFSATITITYPANSTCVVTDSSGATIASDTNTGTAAKTWTATVGATGTYTITVTSADGSKTKSATVSITTDGQSESVTLTYELVLFDGSNGGDVTALTGGWNMYGHDSPYHSTTFTDESLRFAYVDTASADHIWTMVPNKQIDCTNYSRLCAIITQVSGGGHIFANATKDYGGAMADAPVGTAQVDISALSGSLYVGLAFGPARSGSMTTTKIWLE